MKKILLIPLICLLILTGCKSNSNNEDLDNNKTNNSASVKNDTEKSEEKMTDIKVTINKKTYTLRLEDNNTAQEFIDLLPQEFTMEELNGNEKYVYMDNTLTTNPSNPKHIEKGDVMLYGNNCLVIFYKSFDTTYKYTKIGHIENLDNLGTKSIQASFKK